MAKPIDSRTESKNASHSDSDNETRLGSHIESESESQSDSQSNDDNIETPRDRATTETAWEKTVKADPCFALNCQEALRAKLGLASPEMVALIEKSEFVSLGSHCRVAMSLENMGLRKSAHPLDYVRSSVEGVLQCLETDFADFLSFEKIEKHGSAKFFYGTSWGGSFYHHDIEDPDVCKTFRRRIDRFLGRSNLDGVENRIFVRVANTPQELSLAPKLLETLQSKLPQVSVKLLVIIDMQKSDGLLRVTHASPNLLFYRVHEDLWLKSSNDMLEERHHIADTYAVGIAAALQHWGQQPTAPMKAAVVQDVAMLAASVARFDGGDCNNELYRPQRLKEPRYLVLPKGVISGHVKAKCFGRDVLIPVPPGCRPGQKLELRLMENTNFTVSVKLA